MHQTLRHHQHPQRRQHARHRLGRVLLCLAVGFSVLASPQRSDALDVSVHVEINGGPVGELVAAGESATDSLLGVLTDGACSVGEDLGDPAETLLCALGFLVFTVHTVYPKPDGGTVVHDTPLVLGVPSFVDITGNGVPDAVAMLGVTSLNRLSLVVNKFSVLSNKMPAQVELVAKDPTNLGSPSRFSFGYDQRTGTIPNRFQTSFTLTGISPLRFSVEVAQAGVDPKLTLIASMFQAQDGGTRKVEADANVRFDPAPNETAYDLTLGNAHQHLGITSTPTRIDAKAELIDDDQVQQVTATIDQLPHQVDIDVATDSAGLRTFDYSADAPIDLLEGKYRQIHRIPAADIIEMEAYGKVTGLPRGVTLTQTGDTSAIFTTHEDAITSLEGGFAIGQAVQKVPDGESGALMHRGNGKVSVAGRLRGMRSASLDLGGPYAVDLESQTQPLHLHAEDTDTNSVVDGHVNDLPAHVAMVIDPDNGQIDYDAFGEEIGEIVVDATSDGGFGPLLKRVHAGLYGIPAKFTLTYAASDAGFGAHLTDPVHRIELSADDGTNHVEVPGRLSADGTHTGPVDSGAALFMRPAFVDTEPQFASAARIFGLQDLAVVPDPTKVYVKTASGHVFDATADMLIDYHPVTFSAEIDQLPSEIGVRLTEDGEQSVVDYDAHGSEIQRLDVRAGGLAPLLGRIDTIHSVITDLPPKLRLTAGGSTGPVFSLDTFGNAVGTIEAQALSGGAQPVDFPLSVPNADQQLVSAPDGVLLRDVLLPDLSPGEFKAALHLSGLRGASLQLDPFTELQLDIDPSEAQLFGVRVQTQGLTEPLFGDPRRTAVSDIAGFVDRLPPGMVIDIGRNDFELIKYSADARIDEIFLRGRELDGGDDSVERRRGDVLKVRVQDVPTFLRVCTSSGTIALHSSRCPYDPRPSIWPDATPDSGSANGDHLIVAHIDDHGTTTGQVPMRIDLYYCLQASDTYQCGWRADDDTDLGPKRYVKIDQLKIHNLFLDAQFALCGNPADLLCAHFAMDTKNTLLSGTLRYFDATIGALDHLVAHVDLPAGFRAEQRYRWWDHTGIAGPQTDTVGSVTCPSDTFMGVDAYPLGGGVPTSLDGSGFLLGC